jgi:hypothetical protein
LFHRATEGQLPKHRFARLFSQEEANELIPRLEIVIRRLQSQANSLREQIQKLSQRDDSMLHQELDDIIKNYPELRSFTSSMAEAAAEIDSMGCLLKDIDQGLIDFPHERGDEVVFLCWQSGEPQIVAWHSIESGFADRQPLPGAPKLYLN